MKPTEGSFVLRHNPIQKTTGIHGKVYTTGYAKQLVKCISKFVFDDI